MTRLCEVDGFCAVVVAGVSDQDDVGVDEIGDRDRALRESQVDSVVAVQVRMHHDLGGGRVRRTAPIRGDPLLQFASVTAPDQPCGDSAASTANVRLCSTDAYGGNTGGGVGGLSAAHELSTRGFDVHVYEMRDAFGGKARSIDVPDPDT